MRLVHSFCPVLLRGVPRDTGALGSVPVTIGNQFNVRPCVVTHEGKIWFTKAKDAETVYAFITRTPWKMRATKTFTLRGVFARPNRRRLS